MLSIFHCSVDEYGLSSKNFVTQYSFKFLALVAKTLGEAKEPVKSLWFKLSIEFFRLFNIYFIFYLFPFLLDSSKLIWNGKPPKGKLVFTLTHPTKDGVQTITLPKKTTGRTVSLLLPGKKEMSFREVEVYNGPLLGKHYNGQKREKDNPW